MKEPYRVPLMSEIARIKPNGFSAISLFAGAGGSSLGYRMAGFRMLWASEFVDAARAVYEANKAPYTLVDGRDIREVDPEEVCWSIGMKPGELDLLDGSPPCASFSTSGRREAGWGQVKKYSDREQRTDDLFFEYVRFIRAIKPKVFVAENVSGLVKGVAKGYFLEILRELKASGYRVEAQLLDAQWLGVPQARQRIIFVGVREDLAGEPAFPKPFEHRYSVRDAIPWVTGEIVYRGQNSGQEYGERRRSAEEPSAAITAEGYGSAARHQAFIVEPETDISRFAIGAEWDRLNLGQESDRFFNLKRSPLDGPIQTVTAEGGQPSIASITHPTEKRKFSIAELRRLCSFPDDFVLTGTYIQQWERLGRAVPPLMMRAIAETVRDQILGKLETRTAAPARPKPGRSKSGSARKGAGTKRTPPPNEAGTGRPARRARTPER